MTRTNDVKYLRHIIAIFLDKNEKKYHIISAVIDLNLWGKRTFFINKNATCILLMFKLRPFIKGQEFFFRWIRRTLKCCLLNFVIPCTLNFYYRHKHQPAKHNWCYLRNLIFIWNKNKIFCSSQYTWFLRQWEKQNETDDKYAFQKQTDKQSRLNSKIVTNKTPTR